MLAFTVKRVGQVTLTLLFLIVVVFVAVHIAPGGPAQVLLGQDRYTPALEAELNQRLGLDRPLPEQLVRWAGLVVKGDFGDSYFFRRPALDVVRERLPASALLGGLALFTAVVSGITAGMGAALRRGSWVDHLVSSAAVAAVATPSFWVGILFIVLFAAWLHVLPSSGMAPVGQEQDLWQRVRHLTLPLVTMTLPHAASLALYTRAAMLEALAADYTRTARAKGLTPRGVAWGHVLPNAAVPIATIVGLSLPHMVEGSAVIETVFSWPGVGQLTVTSVGRRDYPVLLVLTLLVGGAVVLANFLTDLAYWWLDPRMEEV